MLMWEKKEMPDREYNKDSKMWIDTGKMIEKTLYTFRGNNGNVIVLYGSNEFREYEGRDVKILVEINQREWQGKRNTRVKLLDVNPA